MAVDFMKRNGLTFDEWLNSGQPLPPGFKEWRKTYSHWDQGNPLDWAIACFLHIGKPSTSAPWLFDGKR